MKKREPLVLKGLTKKIRTVLMEAPSTAREISDELEITAREATVGVWMLKNNGQVCSKTNVPNNDSHPKARKTLKLYELTSRGRNLHRRFDK